MASDLIAYTTLLMPQQNFHTFRLSLPRLTDKARFYTDLIVSNLNQASYDLYI